MSNPSPYDADRELFTDADARFQESLSSAFTAHAKCVALFLAMLTQIEKREAELQESVDELRRLLLGEKEEGPS